MSNDVLDVVVKGRTGPTMPNRFLPVVGTPAKHH